MKSLMISLMCALPLAADSEAANRHAAQPLAPAVEAAQHGQAWAGPEAAEWRHAAWSWKDAGEAWAGAEHGALLHGLLAWAGDHLEPAHHEQAAYGAQRWANAWEHHEAAHPYAHAAA